ncbi:hypothetical protein GBAR_LOCUS30057 [Geodia barretti]|uniref:Uncharacterized protein n=1 Tax=Geodia barretti TaxID=519541 RepID=A0AA35TW89_GEOBA|nr:hypothetical protein GBAR_LOCUS30057 [Geodia barretti]
MPTFSGKKYLGSEQFQTSSNEAYDVVRGTGSTAEGEYEVNTSPSSLHLLPAYHCCCVETLSMSLCDVSLHYCSVSDYCRHA